MPPRIPGILATSGDPSQAWAAAGAGANAFLAKPILGLADFQSALLAVLPSDRQPPLGRALPSGAVPCDPRAPRDDLAHPAALLAEGRHRLAYTTGFIGGVARASGDVALAEAARVAVASGTPGPLAQALRKRLDVPLPF